MFIRQLLFSDMPSRELISFSDSELSIKCDDSCSKISNHRCPKEAFDAPHKLNYYENVQM